MTKLFKQVSKLFIAVVLVMMGFILFQESTKAASYPTTLNNITTEKKSNGSNVILNYNGYNKMYYKYNSQYKIYCTSYNIKGLGTSCKLATTQWDLPQQAGVAAIIEKVNEGGLTKEEYYYTQLAINRYLYESTNGKFGYNGENHVLRLGNYEYLLTTAKNAAKKATTTFQIQLSSSNLSFTEQDGYYVSNKVTVSDRGGYLNGFNVTVSGASKAEVINKTATSFQVRVPVSSLSIGGNAKVNVEVKATKTFSIAKRFDCGSGNQYLTPNVTDKYTTNSMAQASGKIENKGNRVEISKKDVTTKEELPGATLIVKDSSGKQIDKWVSTKEVHVIKNLKAGKYTLTEIQAPNGYKLSEETVEFTVKEDGSTTKVVMYNAKEDKYLVKVVKKDSSTKENLAGATLVIKDEDGKKVAEWVSKNDPYYLADLKAGKYTLVETKAPEGYKLSEEVIEFTLKKGESKEIELVMYNSKIDKYVVRISKQDITTKEELPGATLIIKNEAGEEVAKWVSSDQPHYIDSLKPGKYTLTEIQAPEGYDLSYEVVEFTVSEDSKIETEVVMYNSKTPVTADSNIILIISGLLLAIGVSIITARKLKLQK